MRHPNEGVLRRLVDEPAGVADADRTHVADCPVCLVALAETRDDAAAVGAALRFVVVVTGAGVGAANDWLPIFSSADEIEPVAIGSDLDLSAVPDLTDYGTLEFTGADEPAPVADEAAAEAFTGLDVPEAAALPDGASGDPQYMAIGEVPATFT